MIREAVNQVIQQMKQKTVQPDVEIPGRVGSISRDLSKGKVSADSLPIEPPQEQEPIKYSKRPMQEGGEVLSAEEQIEIDQQMGSLMPKEEEEEPTHIMPDGTVMPGATHEEYMEETQLPDEEMEDNYLGFIIDEALDEGEEQYLLDRLNEDDELSIIFDKVVQTASEFSGSGPIEGPGSAVSDSIPARLSDGEFVMTAKAANQIGPEALQELMELAEQEADGERQTASTGGLAQTEGTAIVAGASEDERGLAIKNREAMRLLDPRLSLFAG